MFFALPGQSQQPAPVATKIGLVQGVAEKDLTVYKGIPFAAPPVGDLRWRAPQPAAKWEGVRAADKFGPDPYQGDGKGNVSEDCLYLNVWTSAAAAGARLPVMVWIFGGAYTEGGGSSPHNDGAALVPSKPGRPCAFVAA